MYLHELVCQEKEKLHKLNQIKSSIRKLTKEKRELILTLKNLNVKINKVNKRAEAFFEV